MTGLNVEHCKKNATQNCDACQQWDSWGERLTHNPAYMLPDTELDAAVKSRDGPAKSLDARGVLNICTFPCELNYCQCTYNSLVELCTWWGCIPKIKPADECKTCDKFAENCKSKKLSHDQRKKCEHELCNSSNKNIKQCRKKEACGKHCPKHVEAEAEDVFSEPLNEIQPVEGLVEETKSPMTTQPPTSIETSKTLITSLEPRSPMNICTFPCGTSYCQCTYSIPEQTCTEFGCVPTAPPEKTRCTAMCLKRWANCKYLLDRGDQHNAKLCRKTLCQNSYKLRPGAKPIDISYCREGGPCVKGCDLDKKPSPGSQDAVESGGLELVEESNSPMAIESRETSTAPLEPRRAANICTFPCGNNACQCTYTPIEERCTQFGCVPIEPPKQCLLCIKWMENCQFQSKMGNAANAKYCMSLMCDDKTHVLNIQGLDMKHCKKNSDCTGKCEMLLE